MTSINHLFRKSMLPQRVNDAGYIIPATTAVMIHAVYRYPFNDGMPPKPQAMLIEKHTAIGLYREGFCIKIPMSKTIISIPAAINNPREIFLIIWKHFRIVTSIDVTILYYTLGLF